MQNCDTVKSCLKTGLEKTKKCQPADSDTPDLIQTECVTDSGLARPNKNAENTQMEKELKPAEKLVNEMQLDKALRTDVFPDDTWIMGKYPQHSWSTKKRRRKKVSACCQ